jgi:addiction module RelE/StbE family toxin
VPLKIVWTPRARTRLRQIRAFVAQYKDNDKPDEAERLTTRIVAVIEALREHPHLGRVEAEPGSRELVIGGTPYIVSYWLEGERVTISTIRHGAQRR